MREICCVNLSTEPFPDFDKFLGAAQKYADLVNLAGWPACVLVKAAQPQPGKEQLVVWDTTDQPGALAYHDNDAAPTGHTFRKTAESVKVPFSVPWGHELAEQLGNPWCNLYALSAKGNVVCHENVDAVEDPRFGFVVDGYLFPDFVYPNYFNPNGKAPFDHQGLVTEPFQVLPGGYLDLYDPRTGTWRTLHGSIQEERAFHLGQHPFTRFWRRRTGARPKALAG